jgi:ABC-type amino acid transport substrate-binding protein
MPKPRCIAILVLAALLAAPVRVPAESPAAANTNPDKVLIIGTKEAPPFAMKQADGSWYGMSIELWRRIAGQLHLRYDFREATLQELIDHTADGTFDAAVGALTVTSAREKVVDFTQPFYMTGLGIAVPARGEISLWPIIRSLVSLRFLQAVLALVAVALCVGLAIWLIERRHTEHFGGGARGLGTSVWWSATAMTQAGANDRAPITLPGRMLAIAWMVASVIVIASFTAGITSQLTTKQLRGLVRDANDLRGVRVGAVSGTATVDYLKRERIPFRGYASAQDGLGALQSGTIDAFVYDRPLLQWLVRQGSQDAVQVLDVTLGNENYAIALPTGSKLRIPIDVAMLDEIRSDWWREVNFRYLGKD